MELETIKISPGLLWWKKLVEGSRFVRVELIHHNPDAIRIRVVNIRQFDHPVNPLCSPLPFGHFDSNPASQWFSGDMESLFSVAAVAVIDTCDRSSPVGSGSRSCPRSALLDSSKQTTGRFSS
jgi:hypothetical protein